ncbi:MULTISPECIES: endo-1,4-beta-xylanase [Bacteroidaceae]|uniref:endo-1,4-beta-xylanase n=1 Tax=Bacteroidaceae TaxID=815 RepID=UPI00189A3262|nr:endo-1,4-beta-xylanase [Phocaeicola vulgatus]
MKHTFASYIFSLSAAFFFSLMACSADKAETLPDTENVEQETEDAQGDGMTQEEKEELMKLPYRKIIETYYDGEFYFGMANKADLIGQLSTDIADREFNYITPCNDFKQSYIHPTFNRWRWEKPDAYLAHAKANGQILRAHGPISPQCSPWAREDNRTPEELSRMLEEFMTGFCMKYNSEAETIPWMDVVNETIAKENLKDPVFGNQVRGEWFAAREGNDKWENPWTIIGYDEESAIRTPLYIDMAFEISNRLAPDIKQIINQHGDFEEVVWQRMKELVKYLRDKGRRIDGIGWQAHINAGWEKVEGNVKRLDDFITWCHTNNFEFHITEMNVWTEVKIKGKPVSFTEEEQAETFAAVIETVLKHYKQGKVGVNFWNVRDEDTANPTWKGCIWRNDGTPRPAYNRIKEVLVKYIEKK